MDSSLRLSGIYIHIYICRLILKQEQFKKLSSQELYNEGVTCWGYLQAILSNDIIMKALYVIDR